MILPLAANVIERAGGSLGGFLPRLAGALMLLVVGWVLARVVAWLVRRALAGVGADELAERWGVGDTLRRAGIEMPFSELVSRVLRVALRLVVVFAALSLLGLEFLSDSLNAAVLFIPKLLAAAALVLAGVVIGGVVRERVERLAYQMDFPLPLGRIAQLAVIAIFAITAAAQITVSTAILMVLIAILLAAAAATFALAFGLGGRDVARELSAARYLRAAYSPGQTIGFGDVRGEIVSIENASTILRGASGTIRVPNSVLLNTVVRVEDDARGEPGASA